MGKQNIQTNKVYFLSTGEFRISFVFTYFSISCYFRRQRRAGPYVRSFAADYFFKIEGGWRKG